MFENNQRGRAHRQAGVSLIMTFFIMIIILAVIFFISALLFVEVRRTKNIGDSVSALYAADSGIEKILYYDYKVIPYIENTGEMCDENTPCPAGQICENNTCQIPAARGLCTIFDEGKNPNTCPDGTGDPIACYEKNSPYIVGTDDGVPDPKFVMTDGCDPNVCADCMVSFKTSFDGREYTATGKIYPVSDEVLIFEVKSTGTFGTASRGVNVAIMSLNTSDAIAILDSCAEVVGNGVIIKASAFSTIGSSIGRVYATIKKEEDGSVIASPIEMPFDGDKKYYEGTWNGTGYGGNYTVDVTAIDNSGEPPNEKKVSSVRNCSIIQ